MKHTKLLMAAVICTFFGSTLASANAPDPMASLDSCLSWAQSTGNPEAAQARCHALKTCKENHSESENSFRECTYQAENDYHRALSRNSSQSTSNLGVTTRVVTDVADSDYDEKGPEVKGWKNSDLE